MAGENARAFVDHRAEGRERVESISRQAQKCLTPKFYATISLPTFWIELILEVLGL